MRDSTSLKMLPYLSKKKAIISYYDPSGEKNEFKNLLNCKFEKNIKENCLNADLIILLTEWDEFKTINFKKINKNRNVKIYDLRNLYDINEMKRKRIKYNLISSVMILFC
jgi:UDPglucose 6-dehydrogenase